MDDFDFASTVSFAAWLNTFTMTKVDQIEAHGDRMALYQATVAADMTHDAVRDDVSVTRTAGLLPTAEIRWIYDRLQRVIRTLDDRLHKFDISGFSEPFQYSIYHASDRAHYDWHVDQGNPKAQ